MTVAQLIAKLQEMPGHLPVVVAVGKLDVRYHRLTEAVDGELFEANHALEDSGREVAELCAKVDR